MLVVEVSGYLYVRVQACTPSKGEADQLLEYFGGSATPIKDHYVWTAARKGDILKVLNALSRCSPQKTLRRVDKLLLVNTLIHLGNYCYAATPETTRSAALALAEGLTTGCLKLRDYY